MKYIQILTDLETNRVLGMHQSLAVIVHLNEVTTETAFYASILLPRELESLESITYKEYLNWQLVSGKRELSLFSTPPDEKTQRRAELVEKKIVAVDQLLRWVNGGRFKIRTGVDFQETVYMLKRLEAQSFRDAGYPDVKILEYPFVLQNAEISNLGFKESADAILFASKIDEQMLLKTELMRLKYLPKIKNAVNEVEIQEALKSFKEEFYGRALV